MRKKLYKAKKNWVIGTIVAMTITLGTSFVMTTSIHADVNQQVVTDNNTRNTLVSSQQSTTNTSYGNSVNQESITGRIKDVPDQNTNGQQTVQQQNEEDATQSNVSQKQAAHRAIYKQLNIRAVRLWLNKRKAFMLVLSGYKQ